jgi:small subunit ribosomal protein S6e
MATFKVVVSDPAAKKTEAKEIKDAEAALLVGRKIGEVVDASTIGLGKVMVTGGSDRAGFPMRADIMGGGKKYVLLTEGVGFRHAEEGMKKRKLVRGNTITEEIYQVNVKKLE